MTSTNGNGKHYTGPGQHLKGQAVLVTGGTGSFGNFIVYRLLQLGAREVRVLSRDEKKQYDMRVMHRGRTDLTFAIGDIRERDSVEAAMQGIDVVFQAAALKQVPTCEHFPLEAIRTNALGAENVVWAALRNGVKTVVAITTDKAVKPVNVMGMTKALQERVLARANLDTGTRFVMVRYGNVLASRGSAIPLFREQIRKGGPVTITDARMTRFLMSLDHAVSIILAALVEARPGQTFVPRAPAARMVDVARAMIGARAVETRVIGVRPGEKIHEILVSEDEARRTWRQGDHLVIDAILPELASAPAGPVLQQEYSSADELIDAGAVARLLAAHRLMPDDPPSADDAAAGASAGEVLR